MFKPEVICIGSATLDNFLTVEQPLSSIKLGDKILVKSIEKHSGGGATNSAAALSKLGLEVKLLTKLGKDHDAEFILKELDQFHIKNICKHSSHKNTDFATIIYSAKEKDRIIFVHKGASLDLSSADFEKSDLNADWIYLASLMGKSFNVAKEIARYAHKKEIKLLFNPSLYLAKKGKKCLASVLKATDILVLNKNEAEALLCTTSKNANKSPNHLLKELSKLGPKIVIITDGPNIMYAYFKNNICTLHPPKVNVVQTAGAGDAFTAGFLAGIIKKYSFEDALKLGQVNALAVIQKVGTKAHLLNEKQALQMISKYKIRVIKK